jgi:hypothetical protein
MSYHSKDLLFRNVAFAASRKNKDVTDINDDSDDNNYQLKTPPPAVYQTSGMSPSPQKKKQKSSRKEIAADFLSCMVNQVSTHICGTPTTQKTTLSVLEDLAKSNNNISKMIVSSKLANGTPSYGILQEVSLLLLQSKKISTST